MNELSYLLQGIFSWIRVLGKAEIGTVQLSSTTAPSSLNRIPASALLGSKPEAGSVAYATDSSNGIYYADGAQWIKLIGNSTGTIEISGDATAPPSNSNLVLTLASTGVIAGPYNSANITVDEKGRITSISNGTLGTVTDVTGVSPISSTGGSTPAISLNNTDVTPGAYTNASITVDAQGRLTSASSGTGGTGTVTSVGVSGSNGIGVSGSPVTTSGTIALSLGAITPTSVAASGAVTGSNLSGTNTGDQTSIVGITGTLAEFNTALTGADFATGGGTATGTNTGDQTISITGDGTASGSVGALSITVTKINGTSLGGLATGLLKNTTSTGVPSIAAAGTDYVVPGGNVATATALATARAIYGNNFDGTAALTQIIASTYGGTGNGFTKFSGPTTAERVKTMRDATDTVLELGGSYTPTGTWTSLTMVTPVLGTPTSGNLANCTFPTLNQNTSGSAAQWTTGRTISLTGDVTYTSASLDGTANVTAAATVANIPVGATFASDLTAQPKNNGGWSVFRVSGSDATTTGTTLVDITGLVTGTLSNSTLYEIEAVLGVSTSAVTTGCRYAVFGGGTGSAATVNALVQGTTTTAAAGNETINTIGTQTATAYLTTSASSGTIIIRGFVTTRSTGTATISLQHLKVTSGTSTVKIGSIFRVRKA